MTEELSDLILNFKRDAVLEIVERRLGAGEDPLQILDDCRRGMTLVGERFQQGDFFLADLIVSAEIFKDATAVIEPRLSRSDPGHKGCQGKRQNRAEGYYLLSREPDAAHHQVRGARGRDTQAGASGCL